MKRQINIKQDITDYSNSNTGEERPFRFILGGRP
jgi:hypothetical protein